MFLLRITAALGFTTLVVGCSNFLAVNTTAGQLVIAASSWNSVADEFEASCVRRNQVSDVRSDCSTEKRATVGLEAANKILSAYFTALQQASIGSNFSVDSGMGGLSSSVQSIPGVKSTQVQALGGLASFLVGTATKTLEQRTIDLLITGGAPKAEAAINVMSSVVVPQLTNVFNREKAQTLTTFTSYIQQSGTKTNLKGTDCNEGFSTNSLQTGIAYLLAQAYCTRITAISTKMSALKNYKNSLTTAKMALKNLESGKDNLGGKALTQQLISQVSVLKSDIDKINKAF